MWGEGGAGGAAEDKIGRQQLLARLLCAMWWRCFKENLDFQACVCCSVVICRQCCLLISSLKLLRVISRHFLHISIIRNKMNISHIHAHVDVYTDSPSHVSALHMQRIHVVVDVNIPTCVHTHTHAVLVCTQTHRFFLFVVMHTRTLACTSVNAGVPQICT